MVVGPVWMHVVPEKNRRKQFIEVRLGAVQSEPPRRSQRRTMRRMGRDGALVFWLWLLGLGGGTLKNCVRRSLILGGFPLLGRSLPQRTCLGRGKEAGWDGDRVPLLGHQLDDLRPPLHGSSSGHLLHLLASAPGFCQTGNLSPGALRNSAPSSDGLQQEERCTCGNVKLFPASKNVL